MSEPIFLVGAERSGTTLLRLMLDGHSQLAFHEEAEFLVDPASDDGRWPEPAAFREHLAGDRVFGLSGLALDPSLDARAQCRAFLEQIRARAGKPLVGATVHRHFDRLLHLWPAARFLHIVRDGRDVAFSRIGRGWSGSLYGGAAVWLEAEELWDRTRARLAPGAFHEVRYEALVADPRASLQAICAFLGLDFEPAMLEVGRRSRYAPPEPGREGRWRSRPARDQALTEGRLGEMLARRGYPPGAVAPALPGALERRWLELADRAARWRHSARELGVGLRLGEALTRRLGLRRWHRRLLARVHAIRNANLD